MVPALILGRLPLPSLQRASQVVLVVNNSPANARDIRDAGSAPGSGRFPGEGNDDPLQYSCLENPMDRGAWWATISGSKRVGQTWLKWLSTHAHIFSSRPHMAKSKNHLSVFLLIIRVFNTLFLFDSWVLLLPCLKSTCKAHRWFSKGKCSTRSQINACEIQASLLWINLYLK